jgi:hypothetical protein
MNLFTSSLLLLLATYSNTEAFTCRPSQVVVQYSSPFRRNSSTFNKSPTSSSHISISAAADASIPSTSNDTPSTSNPILTKQQKLVQQIKNEGGRLSFNTKYGALNPYAIYYGLTSILLGIIWFVALSFMQILYKLTGDRLDEKRRIPVFLSQCWGTALLALTGCFPKIENWDRIRDFHKR